MYLQFQPNPSIDVDMVLSSVQLLHFSGIKAPVATAQWRASLCIPKRDHSSASLLLSKYVSCVCINLGLVLKGY